MEKGQNQPPLTSTTSSRNHQPSSNSFKVQEAATIPSSSTSTTNGAQLLNEMLVPLKSTTALICEPVFNNQMSHKSAFWYKNGKKIAEVTGHSNAVVGQPVVHGVAGDLGSQEQFPQVGFLILHGITFEDEGDYWCAKEETPNQPGERLVSELPSCSPSSPTNRTSRPYIHWFFNGEPVDFAGSGSQIEVLPNGSLLIQHYGTEHAGEYKCVWSNFADSASIKITLGVPGAARLVVRDGDSGGYFPGFCTAYLRSGILWFLIGCVATSCIVLVYLFLGMLCYSCSDRRNRSRSSAHPVPLLPTNTTRTSNQQPTTCWKQCCWLLRVVADPSASPPGFRKPIAPVADRLIRATSSTQPMVQEDVPEMD
uniref:Ig-like domain-containing protein n=1 Tax=Ditylenchus dipsaci TaxID=166011 RepID=A0A915ESI9_9BILA